ncbi:MAG TPA: glycosyltransferase family 39 protein [bacterium]|jgi:4-amino-4-deoxy-L-arabinose transferase-like glycosyltransferase
MKHRYFAWLLLIAGMVWCRAGFVEDVFYNIDEAEYAVAGSAMNHGWLPGVDLLGSTKPPGISALFNVLFHIFGHNLGAVHVVHVVIMIATGMLVMELAIALWGMAAAIPAAVLFWMVSNTYHIPSETLALNVESPEMLLAVAALLLAWMKPQKRWALVVAGAALGMGALFRQSVVFFALPMAAAIWREPSRRLYRMSHVAAGFVLAWLPLLAIYAASGALGWAWDSWVRYPIAYSGDGGMEMFFGALNDYGSTFVTEATVPLALLIGGIILQWRDRSTPRAKFLLWMTAAATLALCAGSRFFGHYWIQIFPVATLLGVSVWLKLAQGTKVMKRLLGAAVVIGGIMAILHFPTWRSWDPDPIPAGFGHYSIGADQLEVTIGHFARANTTQDETITVWGYCPQIYYYADRLPGTRDYLCHYTTGYSPGTFDPTAERAVRSEGHPQAKQMFLDDLEKRKPKYIIDLVQVRAYAFPFYNYSLRDYPELASYVRRNYLPEGKIGEALIYRRRTASDTWQPADQDVK